MDGAVFSCPFRNRCYDERLLLEAVSDRPHFAGQQIWPASGDLHLEEAADFVKLGGSLLSLWLRCEGSLLSDIF